MGILSHGFGRFIDLTDVPSSYIGNAGKYLKVNPTGSGIEFTSTGTNSFETVNKNLSSYPATLAYTGGGDLNTITYTVPGGTIVKTLNYTAGDLTSIVLSGSTPAGISLTKTLTYTSGNLTGVTYS